MTILTQERLKEVLRYDPESGQFFWIIKKAVRTRIGDRAGWTRKRAGYRTILIDGKSYMEHRLAWLYVYGKFPDLLDHINRDPSCNRIDNLREATQKQNTRNRKSIKTGLKGAYWKKRNNKWASSICCDGKQVHLGYFDTAEEAHVAYCVAAKEKFGEFFYSGIPDEPGVNAA
jgi:hypothetical protein